ncbi:MAG: hypothetical protein ACPGJV_09850 [Bacteriovoracaceae bacterium]
MKTKLIGLLSYVLLISNASAYGVERNTTTVSLPCFVEEVELADTVAMKDGRTKLIVDLIEDDADEGMVSFREEDYIINGKFNYNEISVKRVVTKPGWFPKCGLEITTK